MRTIERKEMFGETNRNISLPKSVKGRVMVAKSVNKETVIKGVLGIFAFPKKRKVLTENISAISVKILSINQRV